MKTIFIVYSSCSRVSTEDRTSKRYSFNTTTDVSIGDILYSKDYTATMHVVTVLDQAYKYFNTATGEVSNELNSTNQYLIKELEVRDQNDNNKVIAYRVRGTAS